MKPTGPQYLHREDYLISGGHAVVFLVDLDGEFVIRLLRRGKPPTYITPKVRVDREQLISLADPRRVARFEDDTLTIRFEGETVMVMCGDSLAGWAGRRDFGDAICRLLSKADGSRFERPYPTYPSRHQQPRLSG